jgi:hypothetical protein
MIAIMIALINPSSSSLSSSSSSQSSYSSSSALPLSRSIFELLTAFAATTAVQPLHGSSTRHIDSIHNTLIIALVEGLLDPEVVLGEVICWLIRTSLEHDTESISENSYIYTYIKRGWGMI